ncbi:XRE family transcriptional regulator [Bradyrhizobium roseum]|uniref:XRE family transcriptional regulator n=1 Tax=Bradyrhizobium roseum TaxID=3056648 RepID=UPI002638FBEF|nr:XRE family transcriptional regulator [Bradyrhizobium roseus]WKA26306.1 XRE family transcriptional regulator [Bradyrhizobium roseus]
MPSDFSEKKSNSRTPKGWRQEQGALEEADSCRRISASRLYGIAGELAVPITWFFDELEGKKRAPIGSKQTSEPDDWSELVMKRESRQLLELYFGIADERLRRKLMEVAQLLKTADPE